MTDRCRASRAIALLALLSLLSACGPAGPGPTASPSPPTGTFGAAPQTSSTGRPTTAPLTRIGPAALLQPADIGPGWRVDSEVARGDWQLEFLCRNDPATAAARPVGYGSRMLTDRPAGVDAADNDGHHVVPTSATQLSPGAGPAVFAEHRTRLTRCQPASMGSSAQISIVDNGFAGDESILVKITDPARRRVDYTVFVRRNDVIVDIEGITDATLARTLAARAAVRACVVASC